MFRVFFKNITNLNGEMLGSAELKANSGTISDDLLSKPSSTFELISIPPLIENGNVIGIYDDYGEILFTGIINSIEGQTITASNILAIFDDVWRYYDPALETTIEDCIEDILIRDYKNSNDTLVSAIFSQFNLTKISSTSGNLGLMSNNYTVNMYDFIMTLYNLYDILIDIYIPVSNGQSEIRIGKPTYEPIKVGNNTNAIKNIQVTKEVQETNRLVIYSSLGLLRGIWYATPSGITQNASALDRLTKIKSDIVFSDLADLSGIIAEHLSDKMYNHKITCELLVKNSLYNYKDFKLSTNIQVFFDGEYYDSILTGYSYGFDNRGVVDYITLTMGKVRYSLADKLKVQKQEIGQIQNVQNNQVYVKQYVDREIGEISSTVSSIEETTSTITNMLYDTNAPSLAKVYASNNRYFNNSNYSTYLACSIVPITNPPRSGIDNGARFSFVSTDTTNRARSLTWYDGAIVPMTIGTTYVMSCYARVSSAVAGKFAVVLRYGHDSSWSVRPYTEAYDIVSEDWVKYSWTFTAEADYIDTTLGGARVNIGATMFANTTAGAVELCDFYMQTSDYTIVDLQTNVSTVTQTAGEIKAQVEGVEKTITGDPNDPDDNGLVGTVSKNSESIQNLEGFKRTVEKDYATSDSVTQKIGSFEETVSGFRSTVTTIETQLNGNPDDPNSTGLAGEVTKLTNYLEYDNGTLRLGVEGQTVVSELTNTELDFKKGDDTKAWIGLEGLGTPKLTVGDKSQTANKQWRLEVVSGGTDGGLFFVIHRHITES